jgi:hypothetical protein
MTNLLPPRPVTNRVVGGFRAFLSIASLVVATHADGTQYMELEGYQELPFTGLERSTGFSWINPARLADSTPSILRVGMNAVAYRVGGYYLVGQLPGGVAAGYEYSPPPAEYGESEDYNSVHAFALAKRGLGFSETLSGISLGLSFRHIPYASYPFARLRIEGDDTSWVYREKGRWALDGGIIWEPPPLGGFGKLRIGYFLLQTDRDTRADRLDGFQLHWKSPEERWEVSFGAVLDAPAYPESYLRYEDFGRLGSGRASLAYHTANLWTFTLVNYHPYWPAGEFTIRKDFRTGTLFHRLGIELGINVDGGWGMGYGNNDPAYYSRYRRAGGISLRSDIDFGRGPLPWDSDTSTEGKLRSGPVPARDYPTYTGRARLPEFRKEADEPALSEMEWRKMMDEYDENHIGIFRGRVAPAVNTFGVFTTFLTPAGTNCWMVGDFVPGTVLVTASLGIAIADIFVNGDKETGAGAWYGIWQLGGKLIDYGISQFHVSSHNRKLRRKYRLAAAPRRDGAAALASLEF